jgi:hypothetical protein
MTRPNRTNRRYIAPKIWVAKNIEETTQVLRSTFPDWSPKHYFLCPFPKLPSDSEKIVLARDLGVGQGNVPEQILDNFDIHSAFKQVRSKGMAHLCP